VLGHEVVRGVVLVRRAEVIANGEARDVAARVVHDGDRRVITLGRARHRRRLVHTPQPIDGSSHAVSPLRHQ
jgi:hypothetical protein